jgi:hypothetical protein
MLPSVIGSPGGCFRAIPIRYTVPPGLADNNLFQPVLATIWNGGGTPIALGTVPGGPQVPGTTAWRELARHTPVTSQAIRMRQ